MLASIRALGRFVVAGASVFAACGGKTVDAIEAGPPAPTSTGSSSEASAPDEPFDAGGRTCTNTCATPHQCCENGCGGLPVATPTSCCTCLSNEVSSLTCSNDKCGG